MAGKINKTSYSIPGGSVKQIQYNDAGLFGGCSQLFWDKTNNRLGLGVVPTRPFQVRGASTADKWINTVLLEDSRTQAIGVGGGVTFGGKYTDAGSITAGGFIRLEKQSAVSDNYGFDLLLGARTHGVNPTEVMRLHNSRIGIGTISPQEKLHIKDGTGINLTPALRLIKPIDGDGSATGILLGAVGALQAKAGIFFENKGLGYGRGNLYLAVDSAPDNNDTCLADAKVTIDYLGKIGIGTTVPATSALLDLVSTAGALLLTRMTTVQRDALTAVNGMLLYDSTLNKFQGRKDGTWGNLGGDFSSGGEAGEGNRILGNTDDYCLGFKTNNLVRLYINDDGRIGIGATVPATSALLDLVSTAGALLLTRMTTVQRDALTAVNGMLLYDSTLNKFQGYENGVWGNLGGSGGIWTDAGAYYKPNNWDYLRVQDTGRLDITDAAALTDGFPWHSSVPGIFSEPGKDIDDPGASLMQVGEKSSDAQPPIWVHKKFEYTTASGWIHYPGAALFETTKTSGSTLSVVSSLMGVIDQRCASGEAIGIYGSAVKNAAGYVYAMWARAERHPGYATGYCHGLEIDIENYALNATFSDSVISTGSADIGLWVTHKKIASQPTTYPSLCAIGILGEDVAKTFWNGILFDDYAVRTDGVGINFNQIAPKYGIKFAGTSEAHIYATGELKVKSATNQVFTTANGYWRWVVGASTKAQIDANGVAQFSTSLWVGGGGGAPTSNLQVIGLPIYADNAAALAGGLTAGAFYRQSADFGNVRVTY